MNKKRFRIIMVLLVGAFAFGIGAAYQSIDMHGATTNLSQSMADLKPEIFDATVAREGTVAAQAMLAGTAIAAGQKPDNLLLELGEGQYLVGLNTSKGQSAVIMARTPLATIPSGFTLSDHVSGKIGAQIYETESKDAINALLEAKASAAGEVTLANAVIQTDKDILNRLSTSTRTMINAKIIAAITAAFLQDVLDSGYEAAIKELTTAIAKNPDVFFGLVSLSETKGKHADMLIVNMEKGPRDLTLSPAAILLAETAPYSASAEAAQLLAEQKAVLLRLAATAALTKAIERITLTAAPPARGELGIAAAAKPASAGEAITVFKPASPAVVAGVISEINRNLGAFTIAVPAKAESWQEAFGALEVAEPVFQRGKEVSIIEATRTMLNDLSLREQFREQAALETPQAAETISSVTFARLAPNEATSEFLESITTEAGMTVLFPLTVAGEINQTKGEYLTTSLATRVLSGRLLVAMYRHYESGQAGAQPFLVAPVLTYENREVVSRQLLQEKPVEVSLVALGAGETLIIPAGVGYKAYNVTPESKPAAYEYARSTASQLVDIDTPFTEYGPAHHITKTEPGAMEMTLNPKYADIITSETPVPAAAFDIPELDLIAREGPSITEILNRGDGVAENLAAFLNNGQLTPEQVMQGRSFAPSTGTPEVRFLTNRGELPVEKISMEQFQTALGVPFAIKAASAGEALVQLGPAQIELMDTRGVSLGKADTSTPWGIEVLQKIDAIKGLKLAGALLDQMPKDAEEARAQMKQVIEDIAAKTPSVELVQVATGAQEEAFVVPSADNRLERVIVPISEKDAVVVELPRGTYQAVRAEIEVPAIVAKAAKVERGVIMIDYHALTLRGTRKDGTEVDLPTDYVMHSIAILNALKAQQMPDGSSRYHVVVYSDDVTKQEMQNNLMGTLRMPFDGFIQAPTVALAIAQIAKEQSITDYQRFTVSIAKSTIERNPRVLEGFGMLAQAVNMIMVGTPNPGDLLSYKKILLNSLHLLERTGEVAPRVLSELKDAVQGTYEIRGLTVEPEKDDSKAVSRMQAAISV